MSDFDIEAYLEEQIDPKRNECLDSDITSKPNEQQTNVSEARRARDRGRSRSRERESKRRRDRSSSYDRNRKHRDSSRTRENSRYRNEDKVQEVRQAKSGRDQEGDAELLVEREITRKKKEIDDLTKDQRTILIGQLTMKVNESDLRNFFTQIGKVNSVIMIRDKHTGRHKGIGYVEMADLEDIPNCLLFNNVVPDFQKFPILVKPSEAEKNFVAKKDTVTNLSKDKVDPDSRLYIGNIHVSITDIVLRSILEQFGQLETITLHRDELGNSKGFAFARFAKPESAKLAMNNLAGFELSGRALKVGPVIDGSNMNPNVSSKVDMADTNTQLASQNWKLDDDDGAYGMQFNAQSRVALMHKLGQAAGIPLPTSIAQSSQAVLNSQSNTLSGIPSRYIMISNMFILEEETDINWHLEIQEDVVQECSKYGKVVKCDIERKLKGGMAYVSFENVDSAVQAAKALHDRYFAGHMISVRYLDYDNYCSVVNHN